MTRQVTTIIIMVILTVVTASAEVSQALGRLFNGPYRNNPSATETIITGEPIKAYSLSFFHSLMVKDPNLAGSLEQAVKADGKGAKWEETVSHGGRLHSAIYELHGGKKRRYILYLNTFIDGGDQATVIYLEGSATPEKIKRLINTISN